MANATWSGARINKVLRWIKKGETLEKIGGWLGVSRQAVYLNVQRYPVLKNAWDAKIENKKAKTKNNLNSKMEVSDKYFYKLYQTTKEKFAALSDKEKIFHKRKLSIWKYKKYSSKYNGIKFDLPFNSLIWPDKCPVLGYDLDYSCKNGRQRNSPSLDRVDPNLGYTTDNVVIISDRANMLKNNATSEEIGKILAYIKKHERKTRLKKS